MAKTRVALIGLGMAVAPHAKSMLDLSDRDIDEMMTINVKSPYFLAWDNWLNILTAISVIGIVAAPGTLLMTAGQFDLSVGSITAFTSVILANLALSHSMGFSVTVAIAAGIGVGMLNGFLVTVVGINPLIATVYPDQKTQRLNALHAWFPWGIVIGGLDQDAFNGCAIGGLPLHHLARAQAVILILGGDFGEHLGREIAGGGGEDLGETVGRGAGGGHGAEVACE
jgi:hypothetical protein